MDASRHNSPSRKSRFRAQGAATHRPATPADDIPAETGDEAATDAPWEADQGEPSAEAVAAEVYPEESAPDSPGGEILPAGPFADDDSLPAGLRLTRSTEHSTRRDEDRSIWPAVAISLLCLAGGGVGGYFLHQPKPALATTFSGTAPTTSIVNPILPLNAAVLKDIDASFEATKLGQFGVARQRFAALADKNPGWPSMRIESARAALYEHDFDAAEKILTGMLRSAPNADAEFLMGLLQMTLQTYDKSEAAFGRAVALDPSRPDIFYFWGECLRREGKPQDAAEKFREALIRNQYETTEGLYQLKLWLSEIQADQETAKGSNAKIDADLASGHPSGPALFAAAARDVKTGQFKEASERIGQAQKVMEPAVFRVILQDPLFLQEAYRPEFAPFYKP